MWEKKTKHASLLPPPPRDTFYHFRLLRLLFHLPPHSKAISWERILTRSVWREGANTAGPRGKKFSSLGGGENFPTPVHSLILKRGNRVWQSRRRRRPPLLISEAGSTRLVKRRNSKNEEASFLGRLRREKKPRLKMQKAHKGDRGETPKRTKSREGGRGRTSHGRGKNR